MVIFTSAVFRVNCSVTFHLVMATRYLASLNAVCGIPYYSSVDKDTRRQWMAFLNECDSELVAGIRRGDVLENVDQSGYRANGVYFFDVDPTTHGLMICNMDFCWDDYGCIPRSFEVITQFPDPSHWHNLGAKTKCFPGRHPHEAQAYMHNEYVSLPLVTLKPHMHYVNEHELQIDYAGIQYTVRDPYLVDLVFGDGTDDSDDYALDMNDITWVLRGTRWSFSPMLCFV